MTFLTRKTQFTLLPVVMVLGLGYHTFAYAGQSLSDTEQAAIGQWECKWCVFDEAVGQWWRLDLGLQVVSDDSETFGRYQGLSEGNGYGIVGFDGSAQNEEGGYWAVQGKSLWLDSRRLSAVKGTHGVYKVGLDYQQINQFDGRVKTPFQLDSSQRLALPNDWVFGPTTGDLTQLSAGLHSQTLESSRKSLGLSAVFVATQNRPQFAIDYQKQKKSGVRGIGGAMGVDNAFDVTSSILPLPYDYQTEQIDANVSYAWNTWHLKGGYYSSVFKDQGSTTTWQNPFSNGADGWGQRGSAPNNQFQQVYLSTNYRFAPDSFMAKSTATGYLAYGQMKQNQQFLPLTANGALNVAALPTNSLNGKINTFTGDFKLVWPFADLWRLKASYRYNEKDNRTDSNLYQYVVADTIVSQTARRNLPYSYDKSEAEITVRYRHSRDSSLIFGLELDDYDRTYQARKNTSETSFWIDYKANWTDSLSTQIKLEKNDREGDGYRQLNTLLPPDNPLMRKFNLANRQRRHIQMDVYYLPTESLSLSLSLDVGKDDYRTSTLGLYKTSYQDFNLDLSWMSSESLTIYGYFSKEFYRSQQAGSQTYSTPDWFNDSQDTTDTVGTGFSYAVVEDELDIGVDIVHALSKETNYLTSNTLELSVESLPKDEFQLYNLTLFANYQVSETLSLNARVVMEYYDDVVIEENALNADDLNHVLLFERNDQDNEVIYYAVSVSYSF